MRTFVYTALALGLLVTSAAAATVTVGFDPQDTSVGYNETFWITIAADVDEGTPIIGWGLDLAVDDPSIAAPTGNLDFSVGPWDALYAPDGDGLAGAHLGGVSGHFSLVAVEFQSFGVAGTTAITLSDDYPSDLTEGFPLAPPPIGAFAEVEYLVGNIHVPEPATLTLLGLTALLRRRYR